MIDKSLHVVKDKELILLAKKYFKCFIPHFWNPFILIKLFLLDFVLKKLRVYLLLLKTFINLGGMLCGNLNLN